MLPTLRLLIAAMLATIVVLICGFGIFAAFRVSRDPIAHLPAAAPPLQMVAEASACPGKSLTRIRSGVDPDFPRRTCTSKETRASRRPGFSESPPRPTHHRIADPFGLSNPENNIK